MIGGMHKRQNSEAVLTAKTDGDTDKTAKTYKTIEQRIWLDNKDSHVHVTHLQQNTLTISMIHKIDSPSQGHRFSTNH